VSSSPTETTLVDVTMPQMGVSVVEGTVVEWKKQPGDWVERDEIIASISTDKIDTDVEAPAGGRVQEVLVDAGTTVDVGVVLARIASDAKPGEAHVSEADSSSAPEAASEAEVALEAPGDAGERGSHPPDTAEEHAGTAQRGSAAARRSGPRRYSPVVMRIAAEHGIDLEQVEGTGRGGRVRKPDVLAYLENGRGEAGDEAPAEAVQEPPMHIESPYKPEPIPPRKRPAKDAPQGQPLSRMRQSIGRAMIESLQTAATCTTIIEADMTGIAADREKTGVTWLPYVARATIEALGDFPSLNATLEGETFTEHASVNLGIAVSLGTGLIVPVIQDAQDLSIEGLSKAIKGLARKARDNQLTPDDVRGGTFTITNPGGYGSIMATPVINLPQVAILDTEAVVKRPVVITDERGNDSIAIRHMTYLCMSWDHRALDGALAAQFLAALRKRLEWWN
jgi:pyruvate/2-oxoglutarate dehydrogenase complex dihydrolipoamide acyltransferase (E2) component